MAPVYTQRLATWTSSTAGDFPLFTVDAASHYIIRDILVANGSGVSANFYIYVISGGPHFFIWAPGPLPASTGNHLELRLALLTGEALYISVAGGGFTCLITGYVFPVSPVYG